MQNPPQLSPDGDYWWDGQAWQLMPGRVAAPPVAQPTAGTPPPSWLPEGAEVPIPPAPPGLPFVPQPVVVGALGGPAVYAPAWANEPPSPPEEISTGKKILLWAGVVAGAGIVLLALLGIPFALSQTDTSRRHQQRRISHHRRWADHVALPRCALGVWAGGSGDVSLARNPGSPVRAGKHHQRFCRRDHSGRRRALLHSLDHAGGGGLPGVARAVGRGHPHPGYLGDIDNDHPVSGPRLAACAAHGAGLPRHRAAPKTRCGSAPWRQNRDGQPPRRIRTPHGRASARTRREFSSGRLRRRGVGGGEDDRIASRSSRGRRPAVRPR